MLFRSEGVIEWEDNWLALALGGAWRGCLGNIRAGQGGTVSGDSPMGEEQVPCSDILQVEWRLPESIGPKGGPEDLVTRVSCSFEGT